MSQKTQNAVVANVVENATAAVTPNEKGAKVTTFEELFSGHANLPRTEQGAIILTDELFRNLAASHTYGYKGRVFKVLEKRSGTERGGKTLYKVQSGADTFTNVSIEELKEEFGCEYRREKASSSNAATALGKLHIEVSKKVSQLVEECSAELSEGEYKELKNAYYQLHGLVGTLRKAQREAEVKAKEAAEAAARAAKKADTAAKYLPNAADMALAEEFARRANITVEQALKMLGH